MLQILRAQTIAALERYMALFPEDGPFVHLLEQLAAPEDCFSRSNMRGHITTSAAVLSPDFEQLLLIHHIAQDRWLPPGGHYEGPGDLWTSAAREVREETGVVDLQLHAWCEAHGVPFSIDSHVIAARPSKGESEHWHHDFRYLAIAQTERLSPQLEEVHAARWVPLRELVESPRFAHIHGLGRILAVP